MRRQRQDAYKPDPDHVSVSELATELNVEPELIWGIAKRLEAGTHLKQPGGFAFTLEEAERIRMTVRMLLEQRAQEGPT